MSDNVSTMFTNLSGIQRAASSLETLGKKSEYTAEEMQTLEAARQAIISISPELATRMGLESAAVLEQADAYDRLATSIKLAAAEQINQNYVNAVTGSDSGAIMEWNKYFRGFEDLTIANGATWGDVMAGVSGSSSEVDKYRANLIQYNKR